MSTGTRAKKWLGQHWLTDRRILQRVAEAADFGPKDTVIEVGSGRGALTGLLADRASRLIAVEVDEQLAAALAERYRSQRNVSVIEGDVLELTVEEILNRGGGGLPYVVVGNLPYFIGSPIVRKFLIAPVKPRWLIVMLQAEVAERMAAARGQMSYLSVEMQVMAEVRFLFRIPARSFSPPPKVQSAVVRLDVRDSPEVEVDNLAAFLKVAQSGFAAPRKRLRNSLAVGLRITPTQAAALLAEASVDGDQRPQMLRLEDWRDVYFAVRRREATGG
ncbi:MAG TPA: 16S rRNA (adenine(1518)-N(6)/adenine(1519)-N(6))-dimethyltransferase RsmA [Dehalococcoidia bacterium]